MHGIRRRSGPGIAERAGMWSAHHKWKAILGWLGFVIVAFMLGGSIGQRNLSDEQMGNGDSAKAMRTITAADFPDFADEQVLIQGRSARMRADRPAFAAAVHDVVDGLTSIPTVTDIQSPLLPGNEGQISGDRRSALVTFKVKGDEDQSVERVDAALAAVAAAQRENPALRVEEFGDASAAKALDKAYGDDFRKAEQTSLPVTLAILLLAFGSLVSAGVPLLLGLTAVLGTLGLLSPISHLMPVSDVINSVVLLIGLAVGVDYSMFYLRRKLEERRNGHDDMTALRLAAATSGRAVLVSGLTVMTAMAGMLLAGNAVFTSFGVGTILVVAVALVGSLTVLPAVIAALGDRVEKLRVPFVERRRERGDSRAWGWVLDRVLRRPAVSLALGAAFLLALALPALGMRTVDSGAAGLPRSVPAMKTYDRIQAAFPGGPIPALVVVHARDVTAPAVRDGIAVLTRGALATHLMGGPVSMSVSPDRTVAVVSIPLIGNGTDTRSEAALAALRSRVIPATVDRIPGTTALVTGLTAGSKDFNDTMKAHLPIVFTFVLGVAFVLLLVTFRSIVIPITGIALNLLSVGAAYGILKLIFQDEHLRSLLGFTPIGGVIDWLPLFLFVILFGLSMDYHVLILSRIREEHERGEPTGEAVRAALKATAGVVTSAAVVMVAVFSIFATLGAIEFKQLGVGLAVAVLLDATVVRVVLLPSTMKLLGEWNWYLPGRPSLPRGVRGRRRPAMHV